MPHMFPIATMTDAEIISAVKELEAANLFKVVNVTLGDMPETSLADLEKKEEFAAILGMGERSFPRLHFTGQPDFRITIERAGNGNATAAGLWDVLTLNLDRSNIEHLPKARIVAEVRRRFKPSILPGLGNLLGPEAAAHMKAREDALLRLETLADKILHDANAERREQEQAFRERQQEIDRRADERLREIDRRGDEQRKALEDERAKMLAELKDREEELTARQKAIDELAAKHSRRSLYEEQKANFEKWGQTFTLSDGTANKRLLVTGFALALLLIFGWQAWMALQETLSAKDTPALVSAIVTKAVFTALFVSTAFFFIRWNSDWFKRHADEEFRLKRMSVDLARASWFVELANEWKAEKGEAIPLELIQRLTHGLFAESAQAGDGDTDDSLMKALLGASKLSVKLPDGTSAEYGRSEVKRLAGS